jgi:hypothetical protein
MERKLYSYCSCASIVLQRGRLCKFLCTAAYLRNLSGANLTLSGEEKAQ